MKINDLRVSLIDVLGKRIVSEIKMKNNSKLLEELKIMKQLKQFQQDKINFSLDMIVKTMNFFAENKEHETFNVKTKQNKFKLVLKRIKEASFEAIQANYSFEEQATKDPRELLPYSRVSDPGSLKKPERIMLSSKFSQNIIHEV